MEIRVNVRPGTRPIDSENSISWQTFCTAKLSPFKLDQNLKSLHIHFDTEFDLDLKILNDPKQLMHLEVKLVIKSHLGTIRKEDEEITLALSNSRVETGVMVLHVNDDYQASYVLRTSRLQVLGCDWTGRMDCKHSKSIKRIDCDSIPFVGI